MEAKIIKDEKENLIIEMDNQTVAELLRVYLNKEDAVEMAAWKRENAYKPVVLEIKTSGKSARKVLEDAADAIEKESSKYMEDFKKALK